MNITGNNPKNVYLVKLASSVGRVCLIFVFALIVIGCSAVAQAEPLAANAPAQDSAVNLAGLSGAIKPEEAVTCTTSTVTQTLCSVTGTIKEADAPAAAAYNDSRNTYEALAPVPCDQVLTGNLAGVTLAPGVYCFDSAATLTGELTLNGPAEGIWTFKIGTTGKGALTGTDFSVVMTGGGLPCNVSWWVAEDATLTDSSLVGSILAGSACTITRGTLTGNAFSKDVTKAVRLTDVKVTTCKTTSSASGIDLSAESKNKPKCNQGVGNGPEGCDPGNSNQGNPDRSNDENGGVPGDPGRKGGNGK